VVVIWENASKLAEDQVNIAFRRVSAPHHQRFENESEDARDEQSFFHAEFRNPIFDENQLPEDSEDFKDLGGFSNFESFKPPEDFETSKDFKDPEDYDVFKDVKDSEMRESNTPEVKEEVKEENFIDLEF